MKSWEQIQRFIDDHKLPYKVQRFNMSLRGALVGTVSDQAVAYTVRDASRLLNQEYAAILSVTRFASPAYRKIERSVNRQERTIRREV